MSLPLTQRLAASRGLLLLKRGAAEAASSAAKTAPAQPANPLLEATAKPPSRLRAVYVAGAGAMAWRSKGREKAGERE